jgi:hypothetical protein
MGVNFLNLVRQPPRWLRMALAAVLLAFTLDVLAHSLHAHEQDQHEEHSAAGADCAYCQTFNGLMDAPAGVSGAFQPACAPAPAVPAGPVCFSARPEVCTQPRAPPAL